MKKLNLILSVAAVLFFWSIRLSYSFIDQLLFNGFSFILLGLMVINAAYTVINMMIGKLNKAFWYSFGYSVFSLIAVIIVLIMSLDTWKYYLEEFLIIIPYFIVFAFAFFLIFLYPNSKYNKKKYISVIMITVIIAVMINSVFPFSPFRITVNPVVFDAGDSYEIVWVTSAKGTGWIEYVDKVSGDIVKIYETESGNIRSDKTVHKVNVLKNQIDNNKYTVFSTRTIMHLSNSAYFGRTVNSGEINFRGDDGDNEVKFLLLPDVHNHNYPALKAAESAGEFDFAVILGDAVSELSSEDDILSILRLSNGVTDGTVPVFFVRGNHETRGRLTSSLKDYIGLPDDSFYYTFNYGPIGGVVLDTGEDKSDDHIEYAGLARYTEYKKQEAEWLKNLCDGGYFETNNFMYNIVFGHIALEEIEEGDNLQSILNVLNGEDIDIQFAGHNHRCSFTEVSGEHNFPIVRSGGREDLLGFKYNASVVIMNNEGIFIKSYNQKGEKIFEKDILN